MDNRRSGRTHRPSRKLLENESAFAVNEGNGPSAEQDGDESMIEGQMHSTMDLCDTTTEPREAAKATRLAKLEDQKRRRAVQKEKLDKKRQEDREQAKKEGMTLWQFQQRQRAENMVRDAQRLEEEAAAAGFFIASRLGQGIFELPNQLGNSTVTVPAEVPSNTPQNSTSWLKLAKLTFFEAKPEAQPASHAQPAPQAAPASQARQAPTTTREKASEYQKGPGRGHGNFDKRSKRSYLNTTYEYKVKKKSERRKKEAEERKRQRFAAAVADKDMEDLTIGMLNTLVIGEHVDITYHHETVASGVGVWDMFGGKPNWVIPFPTMDPNVLDHFPLGQPLPCPTADRLNNTLSNLQYRREFAESLGMSVGRLKAWVNSRVDEPKLDGVRSSREIYDIASYEQHIKSGGNHQKYISELQAIQENNYLMVLKVQALREEMAMHDLDGITQRGVTGIPRSSTREEVLRRQYVLRERAYRNVVKIHQLRQEAAANAPDIDMDDEDDRVEIENHFKHRVGLEDGFQLKPVRPQRGAITQKQVDIREAEARAIRGDAKPVPPRSKPDTYNVDGDPIRCICGGIEDDNSYTGKWVCCDECKVWQHPVCLGLPLNSKILRSMQYFCEECRPSDPCHDEYFDALERGEEIWIPRVNKYEEEKKRKMEEKGKKLKGKGGIHALLGDLLDIRVEDHDAPIPCTRR